MRDSERGNDRRDHSTYSTDHRIATELHIPPLGPEPGEHIERSHLVQRLVELGAPFVLISAPVGYGKSALLGQWYSRQRHPPGTGRSPGTPFALVVLEPRDNDLVTLWSRIVRGVQQACPAVDGDRLKRLLTGPRETIDSAVLPALIEEIEANCSGLVLALDNYQIIADTECHRQVEYLLNQLPPNVRLVLATRTDPPLPLGRLRASGGILELRMGDLCFTREEIARLVARHGGGHRLAEDDLDDLAARTEGWPAVVHLATRLLSEQEDPAAFLRSFGGNNRYIVDYVEEEVLRPLPAEIRRFLATTAILDHFTARLCDTVAVTRNSASLLDSLERSNLFLVPLDGARTWYRYHHLFRQTLLELLSRTEPEAEAALHRRAGAWYERHGRPGDAIEHALAADDRDRAIRLIARHWAGYVYQGEPATPRAWLNALGADTISTDPHTAVCAAWLATLDGDRLTGQRWLRTAERLGHHGPLPDGMQSVRGAVALYQASFGFGGVTEMLSAARTATDLHGEPTSPWYAQARVALGYSRYLAGDTRAAVHPLEQAMEATAAYPVLRILALSTLSLVTGELSRPAQAADLAVAANELVTAEGLDDSAEITLAQVAHAATLARQGHLQRAREELERAVRVRRPLLGLSPWPTLNALVLLARIALAGGDRSTARALLDEAVDLLETVPVGSDQVRAGMAEVDRRLSGAEHFAAVAPRLTDREEAVLRLLQGSLPLREVAAELFVTVNTVKSHTRLIYRKLGASSRTEAVRRARELGLL